VHSQLLVVPGRGSPFPKTPPTGRPQQKILCAKVRKGIGRGKDRLKIRDLLADASAVKRLWTSSPPPMWGEGPRPG